MFGPSYVCSHRSIFFHLPLYELVARRPKPFYRENALYVNRCFAACNRLIHVIMWAPWMQIKQMTSMGICIHKTVTTSDIIIWEKPRRWTAVGIQKTKLRTWRNHSSPRYVYSISNLRWTLASAVLESKKPVSSDIWSRRKGVTA